MVDTWHFLVPLTLFLCVTAQLKTFIDRCTPLTDTRPGGTIVPSGKRGIAVAVRAGQSKGENQHILDTIHHFFGHLGIVPIADFSIEGVRTLCDLTERESELQRAHDIGYQVLKEELENE
jgi:multimeric flavodoxin WrbA